MKTLMAMAFVMISFEASAASIYMCRSYNTGSVIVANMNARTVEFRDRFGNELNRLDEVKAEIKTLDTDPATREILLTKNQELVLLLIEQGLYVRAETKEDDSFLCFFVN